VNEIGIAIEIAILIDKALGRGKRGLDFDTDTDPDFDFLVE
jgi:hypothetical protein